MDWSRVDVDVDGGRISGSVYFAPSLLITPSPTVKISRKRKVKYNNNITTGIGTEQVTLGRRKKNKKSLTCAMTALH